MHKFPKCGEMAPGDERDLIQAVVTCEGNLHDPDFSERFQSLVSKLKSVLYTTNKKQSFQVRKIEPWNSVRVTISIPKDAAQRLRFLAQQGSTVLRQLGILSVQVEGDQVISLTLTGRFNEPQQVLLRTSNSNSSNSGNENGDSSLASAAASTSSRSPSSSSTSCSSLSSASSSSSSSSGSSQAGASAEGTIVSLSSPSCSSGPSGAMVSLDVLSSSSSSAFLSPNVVAPSGESIPLPPKITAAGSRPTLGGPFPFASMTHAAAHTMQRSESVVNVVAQALFSSSATNSTNVSTTPSPVSKALGPAPSLQQSKGSSSIATSSTTTSSSSSSTSFTPMTAPSPSSSSSLSARKTAASVMMMSTQVNSSNVSKTQQQQQPMLVTSMMMKSNSIINNNNNIPSGNNNNSAANNSSANNNSQNSFGGPSPTSSTNSVVVVMNSTSNYKMAQQVHQNSDAKLSPSQVQHHHHHRPHPPRGGMTAAILKSAGTSSAGSSSSSSSTTSAGKRHHHHQLSAATSGKPRQFLINPLTGHLEPMPSESSSGSDSEEAGGGDGRGQQGRVRSRGKEHYFSAAPSATKVGTKPLKISLDALKINRLPAGGLSSKRSREDDPSSSSAKENNSSSSSGVGVHVNNTAGDGIKLDKIKKLRLKLEKPESPAAALYKMDVTYVKKSEKSAAAVSSVVSSSGASSGSPVPTASSSSSSTTFSSSINSCTSSGTGSQSSSSTCSSATPPPPPPPPPATEVPRVPPLHISLRGKNAAVVVSPRRDESKGGGDPSAFNSPHHHPHSGLSSQSDNKLLVNSSSSSSSSNNPSKSNTLTSIALKRTKIRLKSSESSNHEGVVVKKKLLVSSSHRPTSQQQQQQQQQEDSDPLKARLEDPLKARLEDPLKTRLEDPLLSKTRLKATATTTTEGNKLLNSFGDLTKSAAELTQLKSSDLSQLNKSPADLTQLKSADLTQLNKSASVPDLISGSSSSSCPGAKIIISSPPVGSSLLINPALTSGVNPPPASGIGALPASGISPPPASGVSALPASGIAAVPTCGTGALPSSGIGALPSSGFGAVPASGISAVPMSGALSSSGAQPACGTSTLPSFGTSTLPESGTNPPAASTAPAMSAMNPSGASSAGAKLKRQRRKSELLTSTSTSSLQSQEELAGKSNSTAEASQLMMLLSGHHNVRRKSTCEELIESVPCPKPEVSQVFSSVAAPTTKPPAPSSLSCDIPPPPPPAPSVDGEVASLSKGPIVLPLATCDKKPESSPLLEPVGAKMDEKSSLVEDAAAAPSIKSCDIPTACTTVEEKKIQAESIPERSSSSVSSEKINATVDKLKMMIPGPGVLPAYLSSEKSSQQLVTDDPTIVNCTFSQATPPHHPHPPEVAPSLSTDFKSAISPELVVVSKSDSAPLLPTQSSQAPDSILNQMLSEVELKRNNSQVIVPSSSPSLEKGSSNMEATAESSLLLSSSPLTPAVQSSNALPHHHHHAGTSEEAAVSSPQVVRKGQVTHLLSNVHHHHNLKNFDSFVSKEEEDNNLKEPLLQKVDTVVGIDNNDEESVLAPSEMNTCAPVMAAPLVTCADAATTVTTSRTTTSTSLCSPSTMMNSLTVVKSDDHISGIPGEDSGIDSMDALSEKSPNQGESPARKSESEQHFCDSSAPHQQQQHSCQPSNPAGVKASAVLQSSALVVECRSKEVDLPGQDSPMESRSSQEAVPNKSQALSSSQPLSSSQTVPLLEKSSSSRELNKTPEPASDQPLISTASSSSSSEEETNGKLSEDLLLVVGVEKVVPSPSEKNQVPLSSSPPSSHSELTVASKDPWRPETDLKASNLSVLEGQLTTTDDELKRESGIKSDNNNGGPVDIPAATTTSVSSVPVLQGSSRSAVQETVSFVKEQDGKSVLLTAGIESRSSGTDDQSSRTDQTLATEISQSSQVATKDIEPDDDLTKVQRDLSKVQDELTKVPDNLTKVPDHLEKVPEEPKKGQDDLRKGPDDLTKVSDDLKKVPDDLNNVPADLQKVPDDLTSSLSQPQNDSSHKIEKPAPPSPLAKPSAELQVMKRKDPEDSGIEKQKSEPRPQVNHAVRHVLEGPLSAKEEEKSPSESCAIPQVSHEKIASLLAPVQQSGVAPNISSATEFIHDSLPTPAPPPAVKVSQSVDVPTKSSISDLSAATVDVVTKMENPTTLVKTSEEQVKIAAAVVKEEPVIVKEEAAQEERVQTEASILTRELEVKVEQSKESLPPVPSSSVIDKSLGKETKDAAMTIDHTHKNDLDATPAATPAPSVVDPIQMKKVLVSAPPAIITSAGNPGAVPVPVAVAAGTKSEEVEEKVEVKLAKVDAGTTKADATMPKVDAAVTKVYATMSKVEAPTAKVEAPTAKVEAPPAKVEAPPAKVEAPTAKLDATMTLRSTNVPVATAVIHPTVTVPEEKVKVAAVAAVKPRGHNDIKSDLPQKSDPERKSDLAVKLPQRPVDLPRKDVPLPVLTPAPVASIRSEQVRPVMPNITPLQRPKVIASEQPPPPATTEAIPLKVPAGSSIVTSTHSAVAPILIRPIQGNKPPIRPETSKVAPSPAEMKPKALNLNMTTTTTRTVVPNVIQLAKATAAAAAGTGSKVPVSSSSPQCHSNAKGSPIAVSLAPLSNSSGLTSSAGAPTVFAIHPHQYHHQSAITVLPGGHKMVPIKLVTIPKQNQTQLPMGATRSSPTILETVNLVAATSAAAAAARASSPNSTVKPKVHGSPMPGNSQLNLSSGGNILVPISVSSAGAVSSGGTSSPVKLLVSSAMKMQPNILQSVMMKGQIVMANQNQAHPTTIRVVRPVIQADLTGVTTTTATTKSETIAVDTKPSAPQETTTSAQATDTSPAKEPREKQMKGPMFGHVEGVEVLETEDGTDDDDLFSFAADIIHDEKDLADVLAGENSDSVTENGIRNELDNLMRSEQLSNASSPVVQDSLENCTRVTMTRTSSVNSESDPDGDKLDSPIPAIRASSPLYTYSMRSGRNSHSTSESRSPSPHDHDVHGEDQEIIDCLARSAPSAKNDKSDEKKTTKKTTTERSRSNADHTYGALETCSANPSQQQLEQLSIEIPDGESVLSPAAAGVTTTEESRKSTRSTRSNTRLVSPDITAFRSETPKLTKFTSKPDGVMLRNSPKPSPTGRVHSPTVQSACGPSRASPVAGQLNVAIASGSAGMSGGGRNSPSVVATSRTPVVMGLAMKRKRQESDSSNASKDDNGEESKTDIDLNARPGKRRCSENAAELIKACIGVEDTPKRNSSLVKKVEMQDIKLKESVAGAKNKKSLMAVVVEENEEDSEGTNNDILNRGRCGRSSRGSSEDRSSSRSSSTNRNPVTSKPEDLKDAKMNRVINRVATNKEGSNKATKTMATSTGSDTLNANSVKKEDKLQSGVGGRRSNRNALTKEKSPLATKARANIRKDVPGLMEKQQQTMSPSISAANGNPRRKTRSSVAGVSDSSITSLKRRRISKDAKS